MSVKSKFNLVDYRHEVNGLKSQLVGKTVDEAESEVKDSYIIRVVKADGVPAILTNDVRLNRINVITKNGVICEVHSLS